MISPKSSFFSKSMLSLIYLVLYLPILLLVVYSFSETAMPGPIKQFTLDWYYELFKNAEIWISFSNSIIVAVCTTIICLVFSLLLILYKTMGGRIERIIPLFYGNIMIPDTVLAIALVSFFGFLNLPLGLTTIVISHSVIGLGLSIPLMHLRYKDLNPSLLEASATLGASHWTTFKRIVLPFMLPSLLGTGLMIFILSFDDFILSYFCSGPSAQTLSLYLVASMRFGVSPVINALTTFIVFFTIAVVALLFFIRRKEGAERC